MITNDQPQQQKQQQQQVPALFTENFDYQDMRRDFVNGILTSDLLSNTIHVHVLGEEYAGRVRSTHLYDAISRDIISRWTFPMVPDSNFHCEGDTYQYFRGHVYKANGVVLARYVNFLVVFHLLTYFL